jgi:hypothetical protein
MMKAVTVAPLTAATAVKTAVTFNGCSTVSVHVPVPLQEPPHPENVELPSAVALSVTVVGGVVFGTERAQLVVPFPNAQLWPFQLTVPPPVPGAQMLTV